MKENNKEVRYCNLPKVKKRIFNENISFFREKMILVSHKKWVNGTNLRYYFFDNEEDGEKVYYSDGTNEWKTWKGSTVEKQTVRKAFKHWKNIGIGLNFIEVFDKKNADIRIGFMRGDGSWSFIGRDVLQRSSEQRTMNFGWNIAHDFDTALHEIGHTLGFPHEHQNPNAGIEWNKEKIYKDFGKPPNSWTKEDIDFNIIQKISPDIVQGSNWDPNSIMHYPFTPGQIKYPEKYNKNGLYPSPGLSKRDIIWAKYFYPKIEEDAILELNTAKSADLSMKQFGQQKSFRFKPTTSRKFNIKTFGEQDGVMVLFQKNRDGELIYLSGDDDSGTDKNAQILFKLLKDEEYIITYRQYYNSGKESAIMIY